MKLTMPIKIPELRFQLQDIKYVTGAAGWAIGTYLFGSYLLSLLYHCSFREVRIFSPDNLSTAAVLMSFLIFGAGFIMTFFIPGWILCLHFRRLQNDLPGFLTAAFFSSIGICILGSSIYKIMGGRILCRNNFLGIIILLIILELISLLWKRHRRQEQCPPRDIMFSLPSLMPYCVLILLAILFLLTSGRDLINGAPVAYQYDPQTVLAIPLGEQSDSLEAFGLAHSLRTHLLPYWDLEYADKFGYVFTDTPLYPYVALFAILLFGESFAAVSLLSVSFIIMIFSSVLARGYPLRSQIRFVTCAGLMLAYLFFLLKEPAVFVYMEHFFLLQIILVYIFLLKKDKVVFWLLAISATLTKFYGIFFILLGIGALFLFFKKRQREARGLLAGYGLIVASVLVGILFMGVITGNTGTYIKCLFIEHLNRLDYFSLLPRIYPQDVVYRPTPDFNQSTRFLTWTLLATAFTFPALFVFGDDREERFYSLIGLIYFTLVFVSTYSLPRYVLPLIPFAAMVVSSQGERYLARRIKRETYS